ncbi:MAG: EpsG family protein [Huintestinicola sp.]
MEISMTAYYILFALIIGLAYPMCIYKPSNLKKGIYVGIVFLYMFVISSVRYGLGNDFNNYRKYFYMLADGEETMAEVIKNQGFEPGYVLLMKLITLICPEYIVLNIVSAFLVAVPTGYTIYKYSSKPWLSAWLYVCITFFYTSMNFTRQSIAVAIIFMGYRFFRDKKHLPVVLIILAASMFHMSSLVLLPIYFLSLVKPSWKWLSAVTAAGILVFIFSNQILELVVGNFMPKYSRYLDSIFVKVGLEKTFLIIPFLLLAVVMTAYFLGWGKKAPEAAMLTNFMFYSAFIWLFSVKHFIVERFSMPVYIFILISIPQAVDYLIEYIHEKAGEKGELSIIFKKAPYSDKKKNETTKKIVLRSGSLVTALVTVSAFVYNDFCVSQNVHGAFPYKTFIAAFDRGVEKTYDMSEDYVVGFSGLNMLRFLNLCYNGNYTVLVTVNGNASGGMEWFHTNMLKKLGFKTDIAELNGKSYIGLASRGKAIYEDSSDEQISQTFAIYDDTIYISAVSGGTNGGNISSMVVNGMDFSANSNGLNFVVFDNDLKRLVTAQSYDTSVRDLTYSHTNMVIW